MKQIPRRIKATAIHAVVSAAIAACVAAAVFFVWYPPPFATVAGGLALFMILIGVDVVVGPMLTLVVANPKKRSVVLRRDIAVIVLCQAIALGYGVYSLAEARPVFLVFEVDRFRLLIANDVDADLLGEAPAEMRSISWSGPKLIAAAVPTSRAEFQKSLDLAIGGVDISYLPKNWRSYESYRADVWRQAKPVAVLVDRYPARRDEVARMAAAASQPFDALRFLPVTAKRADAVAILAPDARVVGYVPVDGYF